MARLSLGSFGMVDFSCFNFFEQIERELKAPGEKQVIPLAESDIYYDCLFELLKRVLGTKRELEFSAVSKPNTFCSV